MAINGNFWPQMATFGNWFFHWFWHRLFTDCCHQILSPIYSLIFNQFSLIFSPITSLTFSLPGQHFVPGQYIICITYICPGTLCRRTKCLQTQHLKGIRQNKVPVDSDDENYVTMKISNCKFGDQLQPCKCHLIVDIFKWLEPTPCSLFINSKFTLSAPWNPTLILTFKQWGVQKLAGVSWFMSWR